MPNRRRFRHPGRAEHALGVAIYVAQGGGGGVGGEDAGGFVPHFFEMGAVAAAGFVAAGDEDHVFLRGLEGVGVWGEEGFVVGHCEGSDVFGGDFGGGGADWVLCCCCCCGGGGGDGIGYILFDVGEPVGCLFCEGLLSGLALLGSCEGWQGEKEGLCEMHSCVELFGMMTEEEGIDSEFDPD